MRVTGVEQPAHIGKDRINQKAEATQRVIGRHARIQTDIAEHRRLGRFLATHGSGAEITMWKQTVVCQKFKSRQGVGVSHQPASVPGQGPPRSSIGAALRRHGTHIVNQT